jgi:hypothetical protein
MSKLSFFRASLAAALLSALVPGPARAQQQSTAPRPAADSAARGAPQKFVGFYEAQAGRGMEVTLSGDTLYVEPTGGIKTRLVPESRTTYSATPVAGGSTVTIIFTVNSEGKVRELVFRTRNGDRTFPKVR